MPYLKFLKIVFRIKGQFTQHLPDDAIAVSPAEQSIDGFLFVFQDALVYGVMGANEYYRKTVEVVSDLTGLMEGEIVGKRRMRELIDARCLVVKLMRDAGYYPTQIAPIMNVSTRWVQKILEHFDDRVRYSPDPLLRMNWEQAKNLLRSN